MFNPTKIYIRYSHFDLSLSAMLDFPSLPSISINCLATALLNHDKMTRTNKHTYTGLAWGVGVLAILTALLPIALQGGEEEFEKMKNQDADTWGSGNADALNKNRRR